MHKIIFWDKATVIIKDNQVEAVERNMLRGKAFRLKHMSGVDIIAPGAISRITKAYATEYSEPIPASHRIEQPKPTPEQIEKTDKLKAEIREKLVNRKAMK